MVLDPKQKEIEDEAQQILSKYRGNYTALYNIIKYDKDECNLQGRRKSFQMLIPCSIPQMINALSEVSFNTIYFNHQIFCGNDLLPFFLTVLQKVGIHYLMTVY